MNYLVYFPLYNAVHNIMHGVSMRVCMYVCTAHLPAFSKQGYFRILRKVLRNRYGLRELDHPLQLVFLAVCPQHQGQVSRAELYMDTKGQWNILTVQAVWHIRFLVIVN